MTSRDNNWSTWSNSQTNSFLLQPNFQIKLASNHCPTWFNVLSLFKDRSYNLENSFLSFTLSNHLSFKNLTFFPVSNFHLPLSSNSFSHSSNLQILFKSLHHNEYLFLMLFTFKSLHPPYLDARISFHKPLSSNLSLHIHLANKTQLTYLIPITPNVPFSLPSHAFSQDTQAIFFPLNPNPYKLLLNLF